MFRVSSINGFSSRKRPQYRTYSPTQLNHAYMEVIDKGTSVYKASKMFSVPEQTLRDRTNNLISIETTKSGPGPLLSLGEEAMFVDHIKRVASIGYGYTRAQVIDLATEYAISLEKKCRDSKPLSLKWFYGLMGRWPDLKLRKPRTVTQLRAAATSSENINQYFTELENLIDKYDLKNSPERIYNVDEKGINLTHPAPYIVASASEVPVEISPEKSSTTTILGCGSAIGEKIPPYFIFPGARMRPELLDGCSMGTAGTVTESGWSNSEVFQYWLTQHFCRYAKVGGGKKTLLLYDGHRSHISPHLIDFAIQHDIVLFVLPPHTSHVLQPMDVGCFGPFSKIFSMECRKWQRSNPGTVTRYNVCALACKTYDLALSTRNLQSSFKKCGIYPFDPLAIDMTFLQPSTFAKENNITNKPKKSPEPVTEPVTNTAPGFSTNSEFFNSHLPVVALKEAKPRRSIHKIAGGKPITELHISTQIKSYINNMPKPSQKSAIKPSTSSTGTAVTAKEKKKRKFITPYTQQVSSVTDTEKQNSDSESSYSDEETCCVCNLFQPKELKHCVSLVFTKWGQCMFGDCKHWVHLNYCCKVSVLRRHDVFYCPCHGVPSKPQESKPQEE